MRPPDLDAAERIDCAGRWITPGLIDCHTHLIYAGDRSHEFELRLRGASYDEIARAGGGILSTMRATRAASEEALVDSALRRLDALIAEGVTTVEVKSGYGLDLDTERKQLRAARALARRRPVTIVTTFLGAHALPPEAASADAYIDLVCTEMIPAVAAEGLAEAVDAFCEGIGFSPEQTARVFEAAQAHGLRVRLHADQLSNPHGAALAARFRRSRPIISNIPMKRACKRWRRPASSRCCFPGRFTSCARRQRPPVDLLRRHACPDRPGDRLQPGHFAADLAAAGNEHGRDSLRPDGRRMHCRRHARGGTRARAAGGSRHARGRQVMRPGDLGHRSPGRARLPHGL